MRYKLIDDASTATYVVVCDPGDDAVTTLMDVAKQERLEAAQITAVGAFSSVTVAWLNPETMKYQPTEIDSQCEVLSLIGDIVVDSEGAPSLHLHACVGLSDATTRGGHLIKGIVNPTLEVIIRESPAELRKIKRDGMEIPTIDLDASST